MEIVQTFIMLCSLNTSGFKIPTALVFESQRRCTSLYIKCVEDKVKANKNLEARHRAAVECISDPDVLKEY